MAGKKAARHKGTKESPAMAQAGAQAGLPDAVPIVPQTDAGMPAATVVVLPADCRMAAQAALKAELLGALEAGAIVLDGRQVERVDTAALQLLWLFRRELDARDGKLSWCGTTDALNEAAGLLGLAQILELPAPALA